MRINGDGIFRKRTSDIQADSVSVKSTDHEVHPMKKVLRVTLIFLAILLIPLQTQSLAAELPGADLIDVAYNEKMGLAVLARFDLFLTRDGSAWTEAGFRGKDQGLSSVGLSDVFIYLGTEAGQILRGERISQFTNLATPRDPFDRPVVPVKHIAADSKGRFLLASSGQGVVLSEDGGTSWKPIQDPFYSDPAQREVMGLGFVKGDAVVITRRGVHKWSGKGFEPFVKGLPDKSIISAASFTDGKALVAVAGEGMFEATSTRSWKKVPVASQDPLSFVGYRDGGYMASRPYSRLRSLNIKSKEWSDVGPFSADFTAASSVPTPFGTYVVLRGKGLATLKGDGLTVVDIPQSLSSEYTRITLGDVTLVGTQGGVFRSSNRGRTWTDVTPPDLGKPVNVILSLPDGRFLLGSDGVGVWMSEEDGMSWVDWSTGLGTSNTIRQMLVVEDKVVAATENGLMVTPAGAQAAWKPLDPGVGRNPVRSFVRDQDVYWVGTVEGVYRAEPDLKFTPVKGLEKANAWLDADSGRAAVISNGRVIMVEEDGRVKTLEPLPSGVLPVAVVMHRGSVFVGSNQGTYRLSEGSWAYAGGPALPVKTLRKAGGTIRIITAGGGTFDLK
jgi:photosystem II stability/assembly factor-like uncharacterized protein